jgi:hypothetical protein
VGHQREKKQKKHKIIETMIVILEVVNMELHKVTQSSITLIDPRPNEPGFWALED